ncbi:MAG: hypothetical protein WCF24_01230 [Acidimicrobiales bacterium]
MSEPADHTHVASNGRTELSLDDIAMLHGGFAHFMLEISDRATRCYQAAQARNSRVARHQLSELTKVLRLSVMVRPQYADAMEHFISEDLAKVSATIANEDWGNFDEQWEAFTIAVNDRHEEFDHGYLVWQVPKNATSDLDLEPRNITTGP